MTLSELEALSRNEAARLEGLVAERRAVYEREAAPQAGAARAGQRRARVL